MSLAHFTTCASFPSSWLFIWLFPLLLPHQCFSVESAFLCPLHPEVPPSNKMVSSQVPLPSFCPCASWVPEAPFLPSVWLGLGALSRVLLTLQSLAGLWGSRSSSYGSCTPLLAPPEEVAGSGPGRKSPGIWVQSLYEAGGHGNSKGSLGSNSRCATTPQPLQLLRKGDWRWAFKSKQSDQTSGG